MFDRIKDALSARFANCFVQDGEHVLYRASPGAPPIRLSNKEYRLSQAEFDDDFGRIWQTISYLFVVIPIAAFFAFLPFSPEKLIFPIAIGLVWLCMIISNWLDLWDGPIRVAAQNSIYLGVTKAVKRELSVLLTRRAVSIIPAFTAVPYVMIVIRRGPTSFDWALFAFFGCLIVYNLFQISQKPRLANRLLMS